MTDEQIDRLAALVADALLRGHGTVGGSAGGASWLPIPVRPEPPRRGGELPVWTGAAQALGDVAPAVADSPSGGPSRRRSTAEMTTAVRAAAAGRGSAPVVAPTGRTTRTAGVARSPIREIEVPIGVSNRHVHLSTAHAMVLIGREQPTVLRAISQPGQFAANEMLAVVGPRGTIDHVRVVGPARAQTQVEISLSDARQLGLDVPVAASGALEGSVGGMTLRGPSGSVALTSGVIVAARHLHLSADDAATWGIPDGARLDVRCGDGPRATTFHDVLVRAGSSYATELHLDADEAHAAGVRSGDRARILAVRGGASARRPLVTERDVLALAARGGTLPENGILTPSARDRARALGLLGGR